MSASGSMPASFYTFWPAPVGRLPSMRSIAYAFCFIICLVPVISGGLSVNYLFVPLAIFLAFQSGFLQPRAIDLATISAFATIFAVAAFYQFEFSRIYDRRVISFLLFMSMFAFTVVRITGEMVVGFKIAIVAISVFFSLVSIYKFVTMGGAALGYEAKDLVGSQRFGFIYILGLWMTLLQPSRRTLVRLAALGLSGVIALGLFLTFSRASIVALGGSLAAYALISIGIAVITTDRVLLAKVLKTVLLLVLACVPLYFLVANTFPVILTFFGDRLIDFFFNSHRLQGNLVTQSSSEGTRIYIWTGILNYVLDNPVTGSGFLGVWVLPVGFGSAHNQYMDVLLRTGFLGLSIYLCYLLKVAHQLYRRQRDVFWGFVGILFYGLFHETFKEAQGTFVLAFLLGWAVGPGPQAQPFSLQGRRILLRKRSI